MDRLEWHERLPVAFAISSHSINPLPTDARQVSEVLLTSSLGIMALTLLAATLTSLAPPYLAKLALDDGIRQRDYGKLILIVVAFLVAGLLNWLASG